MFWRDVVERWDIMDALEKRTIVVTRARDLVDNWVCYCGYRYTDGRCFSGHLGCRAGCRCFDYYETVILRWAEDEFGIV